MSISNTEKQIIYNTVSLLNQIKTRTGIDADQLDVAIECLNTSFPFLNENAKLNVVDFVKLVGKAIPQLEEVNEAPFVNPITPEMAEIEKNPTFIKFFENVKSRGMFKDVEEGSNEYLERKAKTITKFLEKFPDLAKSKTETPVIPQAPSSKAPELPKENEDFAKADSFKDKGNELLKQGKYAESVDAYSKAIKCSSNGPNSHIYYSNRAAAYSQLCQYEEACADAEKSVALNPNYAKAHSRLGYAHFQIGRFSEAISSYRTALNIEPNNKDYLRSLDNALKKEDESKKGPGSTGIGSMPAGGMGRGGMPDFGSLMSNPAIASMLGGSGGLEGMMNNPAFMNMAQQVMSNPQMMQSMMGMMGGGGPGGLDMNAMSGIAQQMMSNPGMASSMANLAGGMGANGSSSNSGAVEENDDDLPPLEDESESETTAPSTNNPIMDQIRNNPALQTLRTDPAMAEFFRDLETGGMNAAMKHMSNPAIMSKIMTVMQSMNK